MARARASWRCASAASIASPTSLCKSGVAPASARRSPRPPWMGCRFFKLVDAKAAFHLCELMLQCGPFLKLAPPTTPCPQSTLGSAAAGALARRRMPVTSARSCRSSLSAKSCGQGQFQHRISQVFDSRITAFERCVALPLGYVLDRDAARYSHCIAPLLPENLPAPAEAFSEPRIA